jgi:hypothetical protein
MKKLPILAFLAALLLTPSCPGCPGAVDTVKDCGNEAAARLLDDVNTALATDTWREKLADLVARFGSCVIRKVVMQVAGDATRAQHDAAYAVSVDRAKAWLEENP